jgi:hypothetical protein
MYVWYHGDTKQVVIATTDRVPSHEELAPLYDLALGSPGIVAGVTVWVHVTSPGAVDAMDMTRWLTPPQLHLESEMARSLRSAISPVPLVIRWALPFCACTACNPTLCVSKIVCRADWQSAERAASRNPNLRLVLQVSARQRCAGSTVVGLALKRDWAMAFPPPEGVAVSPTTLEYLTVGGRIVVGAHHSGMSRPTSGAEWKDRLSPPPSATSIVVSPPPPPPPAAPVAAGSADTLPRPVMTPVLSSGALFGFREPRTSKPVMRTGRLDLRC